MNLDRGRVRRALELVGFSDGSNLTSRADVEVVDISQDACRIICIFKEHHATDLAFLELRIKQCLLELCAIKDVQVLINTSSDTKTPPGSATATANLMGLFTPIEQVKNIIAICSGKGGVGKSTMTVCLARALVAAGSRVGIADLDIYGPSIPALMQLGDKINLDKDKVKPLIKDDIAVMSLGLMIDAHLPAIWRGPMASKATWQILRNTAWPELDFLLLDTPPGTGDVHLSLLQRTPVKGVLLVSTPHQIALQNTLKTFNMMQRYEVPTLGLLRNMSYIESDAQGSESKSYPWGNGDLLQHGIDTIADIPMFKERVDNMLMAENSAGYFAKAIAKIRKI
jgi:Mrp family chromosome partitioning ATPase